MGAFVMNRLFLGIMAVAGGVVLSLAAGEVHSEDASPIFGVTIPDGYRRWQMVAPAEEAAPLDELRVVLGNSFAFRGA